jgi:hypothetical protein
MSLIKMNQKDFGEEMALNTEGNRLPQEQVDNVRHGSSKHPINILSYQQIIKMQD